MTRTYLTAQEAATLLRFPSLKALYRFIGRHNVPVLRRGRTLLFDADDLAAWLKDNDQVDPTVTALRRVR